MTVRDRTRGVIFWFINIKALPLVMVNMDSPSNDNVKAGNHKVLRVIGRSLLIGVVAICALIFCSVKFLDSKYLAPMVERLAGNYIDGDVKLGSLRLGFRAGFPILNVTVDNLTVISHAFDSLSAEQRGLLPGYADSLLSLDHISGALDLKRLIFDNEISLHDVALRGLSVNLVVAHDGKSNYDIIKLPADTVASLEMAMPGLRINRFALSDPKAIRFYNAADSTSASVILLTDASVDGGLQPIYRLKVSGNVTSPRASLLTNLESVSFGLNGKVYYDPAHPGVVAMDEMELQGAFIKAVVSGEIDLTEIPVVKRGRVELQPVAVTDFLSMLPDSIKREYRLYEPYFSTNAAVGATVELTRPMNLVTDTLPTALIEISVSPSTLRYGDARITDLALDMWVRTVTNLPDSITLDVRRFTMSAPGTHLEADALISTLFSDPSFDAGVVGKLDIRDLPPILLEKIPGYLSGVVTTDLRARGNASMLCPELLHHLDADGTVVTRNLLFLSSDTAKMVQIGTASIDLGAGNTGGLASTRLKSKVEIDTASILVSGVNLALGSISLDAALGSSSKKVTSGMADNTQMMPITGFLRVGRFNVTSITDSAGARMNNITGPVRVRGLKSRGSLPGILADLKVGDISAGTLSDRVHLDNITVHVTLDKMAASHRITGPDSAHKPSARKASQSHKVMSYIPPTAVYRYVYNKRKYGRHIRRVFDAAADSDEILVWALTHQFRSFLNEWRLTGSVKTDNARLLTPLFPVSNHISAVDLSFNNDTINISEISLKAGKSDITMSGLITDVRRALTSETHDDLKINFALLCKNVDVNELSAGIFTGASYAAARRHGRKDVQMTASDDKTLEARLAALSQAGPGRAAPVLIPVNIDGKVQLDAHNVQYGDLSIKDLTGDILVYDGGVNLHNLNARSDAGNLNISALYSAPRPTDMNFGFGMELSDFDIAKFVKLVPAIDSITPLMHDFSGMVGVDLAATCRIDSGMNIDLPSLDAAVKITGDNLAFIDHDRYRTLGKWLGFRNKSDSTIHSLNVEMTIREGLLRVYPFAFNIDRYRLGVYGSNDIAMNFDYHISVLKSPIPFKFGINISGSPKKYRVRFGGAKFKENSIVESREIVNHARINLLDQIEGVFSRGVRNSSFARLSIDSRSPVEDTTYVALSSADSLRLIQEGLPVMPGQHQGKVAQPARKAEKAAKKKSLLRRIFSL